MALSVLAQRDRLGVTPGRILVDGSWRDGATGASVTHVHPATNEDVTTIAVATAADVADAVAAARRAFDDGAWTSMVARDRKRLLQRVAALIEANADELTNLQTLDNGLPLSFGNVYQLSVDMVVDIFDHHAGWVDRIAGQTLPDYTGTNWFPMTVREPVGVVAAVIPWNAPLMLYAQKVAPALAAGCTVVLKPSEYASLTSIRLTELLVEAGVPDGVINLVTGPPDPTGEALITDPRVDKISFTGSRAVGTRMLTASADRIGRTSLELGGKSPNIIFDDVDVDTVAMVAMGMVSMGLSGQGCVCHTRLLAHESIHDELVQKAAAMAAMSTYGDPFDPATTSAALINPRQVAKVEDLIESALADGAEAVVGGDRPGGELATGNFVNPTLFAGVTNDMRIAREEVFGPVLAVIPFSDEAEAIALANDTPYGLGASVHTSDVKRALRVARAVRAGTFGINGYTVMPNVPFGGYKQSGLGREGGHEGIDAFLETKTIMVNLGDSPY
jgi:aldehyde dehydrogenase (NAD+)